MVKRFDNIWEEFISKENWNKAVKNSLAGKVKKHSIKRFKAKGKDYVETLRQEVINGEFEMQGYKHHVIYEPKKRDIFVARIEERVLHWAAMIPLEKIFEPIFINDSYSCRVGKGQHKCSLKCSQIVKKNDYCLKLDISKFYPSIKHHILKHCLTRKIKDEKYLKILFMIIDSFNSDTGVGVPIGNYSSQIFGNIYMTKLDMFVKHELKCENYLRYCDDFCLFSNNKEYLKWCREKIIEFVHNELEMRLSKCDLFKTARGVDFVGYRHFKRYRLIRKRTAKKIKKRITVVKKRFESGEYNLKRLQKMLGQVASAYGWCKHANSFNFIKSLDLMNIFEKLKITLKKEMEMKFDEIKNRLTFYVKRSKQISDILDKDIEVLSFKDISTTEVEKIEMTIRLLEDGQEYVLMSKAAGLVRDLKEIQQISEKEGLVVFPMQTQITKSPKGRYYKFV